MTRPQYECPDCDRVVWHDCEPLIYRRHRYLPREAELRSLRAVELPDSDAPTLEESWHGVFADVAGGYRAPTPERARAETEGSTTRKRGRADEEEAVFPGGDAAEIRQPKLREIFWRRAETRFFCAAYEPRASAYQFSPRLDFWGFPWLVTAATPLPDGVDSGSRSSPVTVGSVRWPVARLT